MIDSCVNVHVAPGHQSSADALPWLNAEHGAPGWGPWEVRAPARAESKLIANPDIAISYLCGNRYARRPWLWRVGGHGVLAKSCEEARAAAEEAAR